MKRVFGERVMIMYMILGMCTPVYDALDVCHVAGLQPYIHWLCCVVLE